MEDNLDNLNTLLAEAASNLDVAASMIRSLELDKQKNVYKVGEALANIFEIQHEIYERRPDLWPRYLKE